MFYTPGADVFAIFSNLIISHQTFFSSYFFTNSVNISKISFIVNTISIFNISFIVEYNVKYKIKNIFDF